MATVTAEALRHEAVRCRSCGHSRGVHEHYTVPGDLRCALCPSCPGFRARLGERLRGAWAALRDAP